MGFPTMPFPEQTYPGTVRRAPVSVGTGVCGWPCGKREQLAWRSRSQQGSGPQQGRAATRVKKMPAREWKVLEEKVTEVPC